MIRIQNLCVKIDKREIIKDFSLRLQEKEIAVLLGPNGSGKSSLALALAGHPFYKICSSRARFLLNGEDMLSLSATERARKGVFLSFQSPVAIEGLRVEKFLRESYFSMRSDKERSLQEELDFLEKTERLALKVGLGPEFLDRGVNHHFSGGEKKRFEMLQLLLFEPRFAILDEIDTGLDIDGLEVFRYVLKTLRKKGAAFLLITHNPKSLRYIKPQKVLVLKNGKLYKKGGPELITLVQKRGFENI